MPRPGRYISYQGGGKAAMNWKKTRSKALGWGSTLLALHESHNSAFDAAANVGLFTHESQPMMRPHKQALEAEPTDRPANEST
jgi:hypothetical protein